MLNDKLTFFSNRIQYELFPLIESELNDPILDKHYKISTILEIIQIEKFIPSYFQLGRGRPQKSRINIARAFLAKHILNICSTSQMVHMLKVDKKKKSKRIDIQKQTKKVKKFQCGSINPLN